MKMSVNTTCIPYSPIKDYHRHKWIVYNLPILRCIFINSLECTVTRLWRHYYLPLILSIEVSTLLKVLVEHPGAAPDTSERPVTWSVPALFCGFFASMQLRRFLHIVSKIFLCYRKSLLRAFKNELFSGLKLANLGEIICLFLHQYSTYMCAMTITPQ